MYQEEGNIDSPATSPVRRNSYLNEFEDYERYENYMKMQGGVPDAPKPVEHVISDADRNFAALREKTEKLERENRELQERFESYKNTSQKQLEPVRVNPLDGLDQEEALPAGIYRQRENELMQRQTLLEKEILKLNLAMKYPDYDDVVENFAAPLIKENPNFAAGFYSAPDPYKYAYDLGAMARGKRQEPPPVAPPPPVHPHAQRILDNSRKPGSLAQTGGQGSFHHVKDFGTMSDEDFDAEVRRIQSAH